MTGLFRASCRSLSGSARHALAVAAVLGTAASAVACADPAATDPAVPETNSPGPGAPAATSPAGAGEPHHLDAKEVVAALASSGLQVPNPQDTTAQECPRAGCEQSMVTDVLRVKSFGSPEQAQRYAQPLGLARDGSIVVAFAPPVREPERARYWSAVERILR